MEKIIISEVTKKNLRVLGYLIGSWALALALSYVLNDERLVGLAPAINFISYLVEKELRGEGYIRNERE